MSSTEETKEAAAPKVCSAEGCEKKVYVKALCRSHYEKAREAAPDRARCDANGCELPVYTKKKCRSHYTKEFRKTHRSGLREAERLQLVEVIDRLAKQQPKSQLVRDARKILRVEEVK